MSDVSAVKALVFDVFGTVVDWRTSLINDFTKWSETSGIKADWTALVDGWRGVYMASMDEVRKHPERGYQILDTLHRRSLEKLVADMSIKGLSDADLHYLTMAGTACTPGPTASRPERLKTKYIISPLSNGNVALLTNMAKFAGLPWDLVMSAELFEHYKPDPEPISRRQLLCLAPDQVIWSPPTTRSESRAAIRPQTPSSRGPPNTPAPDMISKPRAIGTSSPGFGGIADSWGASDNKPCQRFGVANRSLARDEGLDCVPGPSRRSTAERSSGVSGR